MEISSVIAQNQTAAELMAAAVCELFPGVRLLGGRGTPEFFYYDFVMPFVWQADFLTLIEERMRLIIREKREVRALEMMPGNAASLMQHHGQEMIVEKLLDIPRATVQVCKIGQFVDFCPFPILDQLSIAHFKLIEAFPIELFGRKIMRLVGVASVNKDSLKLLAKQTPPSQCSHIASGRMAGLFEPMEEEGKWRWLPRGEELRHQLVQWWREQHINQNFNLISSPVSTIEELRKSHAQCHALKKTAEIAWTSSEEEGDLADGLFLPHAYTADLAHFFLPEEKLLQECISSLQFIVQIPKIFNFEFEVVLSISSEGPKEIRAKRAALLRQALEKEGLKYSVEKSEKRGILSSIDVRIADSLGRRWTGPFLSFLANDIMSRSTFGSLERWTALLLEKSGGWLPCWIAPEQVRILALVPSVNASEMLKALRIQGIRATLDDSEEKLKARLYRAMMEKVPYVVILGEREEKTKTLTIRAYGANDEQKMTLEEFCNKEEWKL